MKKFFILILALITTTSVFSQQIYNSLTVKNLFVPTSATFNTSFSGVAKLSSGVLSASPLVNADVSNSAAISYTKLSGVVDTSTAQSISGNKSFLNNFSVTGTTTLATSLSGYLKATAGVVSSVSQVDLSTDVVGTLPITNGGTGSTSKSWVDLTTNQGGIAGNKAFTGNISTSGTLGASNLSGTNTGDLITQGVTGLNSAVTNILEFPLNQIITTATGTRRVDTGNGNVLANSSFESSTVGLGWQATNVTLASSTTNVQDGVKSIQITSTTSNWSFDYQSSLYPSAKAGQSAEGSLWVQSTGTGSNDIWLCEGSYTATPVLGPCDKYDGSGQPRQLRIYTPFKSSGSGIRLMGNTSGTVIYADKAKFDNRDFNLQQYNSSGFASCTLPLTNAGNATQALFCKRVGDSIIIKGRVTIGSTLPTGAIFLTLPNSLKINPTITSAQNFIGTVTASAVGISAPYFPIGTAAMQSADNFGILTVGVSSLWNASNPFTWVTGQYFELNNILIPIQGWDETTPAVASESVQVSSDTINFVHKATLLTDSDPVGTYNTFSYGASGNVATICATAPTQTSSSMNIDGLFLTARGYTSASTCALPAYFYIKIPSGQKSINKKGFASSGRSGPLELAFLNFSNNYYGTEFYDFQGSGYIAIGAGVNPSAGFTTRYIGQNNSGAGATNGYVVFNSSRYADIASIPVMRWRGGEFSSNTSQSIPNTTDTAVTYDGSSEVDGFTISGSSALVAQYAGRYNVCSQQRFTSGGWPSSPNIQMQIWKNGSFHRRLDAVSYAPVTTGTVRMFGCANVKLNPNDYVSIIVFHNFGSANTLLGSDAVTRYTTINKVGEL